MGTRGILMVKSNGEYKVAQYSQFDNYPSGQGFETIIFINQPDFDIGLFKEKVDNLTQWTSEEIGDYADIGSGIFNLIYNDKVKKVISSINFVKNSLFCEWGWCINLDTNCLDCFKGLQTESLEGNQPFHYLQSNMVENPIYYPIKLICSIPFDKLSEFNNGKYFEYYIDEIISFGEKTIMDNGIPRNWNSEV